MPEYRIYMNDDVLLAATDWLPVAVAAWHRATRDHLRAKTEDVGAIKFKTATARGAGGYGSTDKVQA